MLLGPRCVLVLGCAVIVRQCAWSTRLAARTAVDVLAAHNLAVASLVKTSQAAFDSAGSLAFTAAKSSALRQHIIQSVPVLLLQSLRVKLAFEIATGLNDTCVHNPDAGLGHRSTNHANPVKAQADKCVHR